VATAFTKGDVLHPSSSPGHLCISLSPSGVHVSVSVSVCLSVRVHACCYCCCAKRKSIGLEQRHVTAVITSQTTPHPPRKVGHASL